METLNYPFNEQQLHFLKMFSKELPDEDWKNVKKLLSDYFANRLMDEMDKVWDEENWNEQTMEEFRTGHFRTHNSPSSEEFL